MKEYSKKDIIITDHTEIKAVIREINLDEVKNNIINPDKLVYAIPKKAKKSYEEKYEGYFAYSRYYCHK